MGYVKEMICNIYFLLIESKAFSASTKSTASTSSCCYKSYIAWMVASASSSAQTCSLLQLAEHLPSLRPLLIPLLFDTILHPLVLTEVLDFYLVELINLSWTPLNYYQRHYWLYVWSRRKSNEHELNGL